MAQSKALTMKYVDIDGEQHIADSVVIKRLNDLEQALSDEQNAHAKTKADMNKDISVVAERVALNLNSGMSDAESCLKHGLNDFDKTRDGEPVFEFRKEVIRRITLALQGKTARGGDYNG